MSIGENIKEARKAAKVTQQELARMINKGTSTIQKYELNITAPPIKVIKQIALALDVDIYSLLYFDSASDLLSDKINSALENGVPDSLVLAYQQLNSAGQQKAVERVEELTEIPKYKREAPEKAGEALNTPLEGKDTTQGN